MSVYMEQSRQLREERAKKAAELKRTTEAAEKITRKFESNDAAKRIMLEGLKRRIAQELNKYVPICIMNEAFTKIMVKALPHDEDYIRENYAAIKAVNQIYLHHLGGLAYLKEQAKATNSAFLKRWYEIVKEDSAEIIKDKLEDIKSAKSESDIKDILDAKVTPAQNDKVKKDIDELNPDEVAELVQNKVLDVVKDEAKRQAEDANFRAELKDRADAYDQQKNETQEPAPTSGDAEVPEQPAEAPTEEPAPKEDNAAAEDKPEQADIPQEPEGGEPEAPKEEEPEEAESNEPPQVPRDEETKKEPSTQEAPKPKTPPEKDENVNLTEEEVGFWEKMFGK